MSYMTFLAAGTLCYSTMNSATFESLYSAFSRMHVQKTWDAMLNAPLDLDDVMLGELVWATSKSVLSGIAILVIILALGLANSWLLLWTLPLLVLIGFCFTGLALVMNALSPNYDFFMYYFTLAITPMVLLCGVFYPVEQLPAFLQAVANWLPLTHAIQTGAAAGAGGVAAACSFLMSAYCWPMGAGDSIWHWCWCGAGC